MKELTIKFDDNEFTIPGLRLLASDGSRIDFSREAIESITSAFWADTSKITREARNAIEFQRCSFCPLARREDICDAIRPILPFIGVFENYVSFDEVTAVYKENEKQLFHVSRTTMQQALRYVSILSLTHYCKYGALFKKYFYGVMPLMESRQIALRLYENIYVTHAGNKQLVDEAIRRLYDVITAASANQVKRLNLITKSDVFMNAFVATQIVTELLQLDMDSVAKGLFI